MNDTLHLFLLVLAVLDLGFVCATGAVEPLWLAPLLVCLLLSPRLRRLQRYRWYRASWNAGVLLVFALLVHHATTTGLLHMLEDGLVLAVLCQVHLLNNVGTQQRPDLAFLNSFLIAFVTSFFAPDVTWSALFLAHTIVFVPALQVHVLSRRAALAGNLLRATLRDSLPRTFWICALTAVAFVFWPRDFDRKGWLQSNLAMNGNATGSAQRIEIGNEPTTGLGDTIVMRIRPAADAPAVVPSHWRFNAFTMFDGRTWYPQKVGHVGSRFASDAQWESVAGGPWRRPAERADSALVEVELLTTRASYLPMPLSSVRLEPVDMTGCMLSARSFGGLRILRPPDAPRRPMTYRVGFGRPRPIERLQHRARVHFTSLPEHVPQAIVSLGELVAKDLPERASALEIAEAAAGWLRHNRRYRLPGEAGFATNLDEFLLGSGAGHCEYFATALALMLRTRDVPCRLIGGYLVQEREPTGAWIARERDAHAWVEVLGADRSWHRFDATPPTDVRRDRQAAGGVWHDTYAWLDAMWADVTGFDDERRRQWLAALLTLPSRRPITLLAIAVAAAACWWLRRRRRGQRAATIADYERALRRAGVARLPDETPRDALARATATGVDPAMLAALHAATAEHERSRYAGAAATSSRACASPGRR